MQDQPKDAHSPTSQPLAVTLDGQVIRTTLRTELLIANMRENPLKTLMGGAYNEDAIDVTALPYDAHTLHQVTQAREQGRRTVLLSDHPNLAERIKTHLNLFDEVTPNPPDRTIETLPRAAAAESQWRLWLRALRLHQWIKNALIFVPLLAAHQLTQPFWLLNGVFAFLCFGLCASSVYLLNDLMDLNDDRHHKLKRHRPFAAGKLPLTAGLVAFPALLISAFAIAALTLPLAFSGALASYYVLTLAYSMRLKRYMALDVIALALLYTLRVIAGGAAFNLPLTFWLLAFAMFLFLSLALAKRYAELRDAHERGKTGKTRGRDYDPNDLITILALGAASGYQSVMVLALYVREQSTVALYANPEIMWLACPVLLFWITRVWMLTHRGQMHEDPVVFAARDWVSQIAGILFGLTFLAAAA